MEHTSKKHGLAFAILIISTLFIGTTVHAAGVVVSALDDSDDDPLKLFTGSVSQSGTMDEVVTMGLMDFTAIDVSGSGASALDTLFMTITAPTGFNITSVSFSESGANMVNGGIASASGSIVVDGQAVDLGSHINGPTAGLVIPWTVGPILIPVAPQGSIDVSIVNSLFAFATTGTASSTKSSAILTVGLTAVPLPPALWMMGAALVALVSVGRRQF